MTRILSSSSSCRNCPSPLHILKFLLRSAFHRFPSVHLLRNKKLLPSVFRSDGFVFFWPSIRMPDGLALLPPLCFLLSCYKFGVLCFSCVPSTVSLHNFLIYAIMKLFFVFVLYQIPSIYQTRQLLSIFHPTIYHRPIFLIHACTHSGKMVCILHMGMDQCKSTRNDSGTALPYN